MGNPEIRQVGSQARLHRTVIGKCGISSTLKTRVKVVSGAKKLTALGAKGYDGFRCKQFWSEQILVALPAGHPLAALDVIHWTDLRDERFSLPATDPGPEIGDMLLGRLSVSGMKPNIKLVQSSRETILSILGDGSCMSVICEGSTGVAELATAGHASCLVFDDPVSSLDHRWCRKVAERLIEEAANRQIIVFTHDLIFLNDLQTLAYQASAPIKEVSLTQTVAGTGIIHEGLPWAGQKIPERLDKS